MERRKMLYLLDARIELTPAGKGMPGAISKAEEIIQTQPDAVMLQQFSNPANLKYIAILQRRRSGGIPTAKSMFSSRVLVQAAP